MSEGVKRCPACGHPLLGGSPSGVYCTRSCRILGEAKDEQIDRVQRDNARLRKLSDVLSELLWRKA